MRPVALLGGGPAGMLAALLAHRTGANLRWMSGGPEAPQTPHIHVLRPEIAAILTRIDARLGTLIAAQTEQAHLWSSSDGATQRAPRLSRAGLLRALRARLAEDGLTPIAGNADDLAMQHRHDPDVIWIDATGGARALSRAFESRGQGQLHLEDVGQASVWQTRYWPDHPCESAFTHVVKGQYYIEVSCHGARVTGCGDASIVFPDGMIAPDGRSGMAWRFIAPPVRRAIWKPAQDAPRLILFGDALLQTPPAMGFGLLGVAQQAALLSEAFAKGSDCGPALEGWAHNVWASAALQDALQTLTA